MFIHSNINNTKMSCIEEIEESDIVLYVVIASITAMLMMKMSINCSKFVVINCIVSFKKVKVRIS